jgi:hypothetical protein
MTNKHTALPWKWDSNPNEYMSEPALIGSDGEVICHFGDDETYYPTEGDAPNSSNAAFIVRAVNSHYELLAALKEIITSYNAHEDGYARQVLRSHKERAEGILAAIAKAESAE